MTLAFTSIDQIENFRSFTCLTQPHVCVCLKPGPGIPLAYGEGGGGGLYFVFNDLR